MSSFSPELYALSAYYRLRTYAIVGIEFDEQNPRDVAAYTAFINCMNCVWSNSNIEVAATERAQCFDCPESANAEEVIAFITRVFQQAG